MNAEIIQITSSNFRQDEVLLVALCKDGSVWERVIYNDSHMHVDNRKKSIWVCLHSNENPKGPRPQAKAY
jgi:hypothetical protein